MQKRRLFSTALNRSRSVVTSRAALLSLRSVSSPCSYAPIAPRQQRWYTTDDNKEVGSEVATDSVQDAIKKVRLNFLPPSRPEALTLTRAVQVVSEYPCVVFMKGTPDAPQCGFSNATIKALNTVGAHYEAFDVLQSAELRDGIKKFTDWPTIPQVFIGGEFVGGCDITLQHLRSGELTTLLEKAKALKSQQ
ncbi:glutaredoxin, putative [Acanthamoeba castellanii str. Neff]|uniref:Glutaredoxin, putative n=1 Tax=Acanthamoeba castellanii (strain ATCC 30010 / Neff) TaxID=1257118 RepID=L8HBT6_ACACF|nr:glutaredoxin, putative [Acanthamoeba castellanii str. Neff]ELR22183.1 glutaredoxin, putative [Acanthamoeba castellanii str. Neff]